VIRILKYAVYKWITIRRILDKTDNTNINSKTVLECRKLLNQLGARNSLKICWIKAHASHAGNEMADRLAKMGANQTIGPARFKYYEASVSTNQSLIA
jgi:ribonuclease HI